MAMFENTQRLTCPKCGNTTFTEDKTYMYDKSPDRKIKKIEVEGFNLKRCAKCGDIYWDANKFFEGATIVE